MSLTATEWTASCEWPGCEATHVTLGADYEAARELREGGWCEVGGDWYCPSHVDAARQELAGQQRWR